MESVTYGGDVLTDVYTVLSERGVPKPAATVQDVPMLDGIHSRGVAYLPPDVVLNIYALDMPRAERRAAAHDLAGRLLSRDFRRLEFGDDGGLYYMAMPSGELDFHEFVRAGRLVVPMLVRDAAMYGETRRATLSGSASVEVGGNHPAYVRITSTNAAASSSGYWGVRIDGRRYVRVPLQGTGATVAIDTEARTAKVNGANAMVTLDSDWLELSPGERRLVLDQGSGEATVEWTERWL